MNIINNTTAYTRYIPTRIVKGDSYLYAQSYYEAGEYGVMAIDPTTLAVLDTFRYNTDRISDISVYSDSRIAVRSDNRVAVLSFGFDPGENIYKFTKICEKGIRSTINTGVACNNDFVFVSCGSKIISVKISTGKIAQELNITNYYTARAIACTSDYLFVRKTSIGMSTFKLAAYRINLDYLTNSNGNLQFLNEIDSPVFDTDLGRLCVDASLNIIEPGINTNRLVTFNGAEFTVVGDIHCKVIPNEEPPIEEPPVDYVPFFSTLEFIKHGDYFFASPNNNLRVFTLDMDAHKYMLREIYTSTSLSRMPTYMCPGFISTEFYTTRDIIGDGTGRNISKKTITP